MLFRAGSVLAVAAAFLANSTALVFADTMTPISVSGFNRDMIVEVGDNANAINASFDGGWGADGSYASLGTSLYGQVVVGNVTRGLAEGVYTSDCDSNTTFQLQAFNSSNALFLDHGSHSTGTLTLTTPKAFTQLALFSTGGVSQIQYTINYADATTTVGSFSVTDWFHGGDAIAENAKGRAYWDGGQWTADPNTEGLTSLGASIYQTTITDVNPLKTITSIGFATVDTGSKNAAIFAVSGSAVPEPSSIAILAFGLLSLMAYAWRKRK